jgi:hypothetical protein
MDNKRKNIKVVRIFTYSVMICYSLITFVNNYTSNIEHSLDYTLVHSIVFITGIVGMFFEMYGPKRMN